jgi:hypothetical protein
MFTSPTLGSRPCTQVAKSTFFHKAQVPLSPTFRGPLNHHEARRKADARPYCDRILPAPRWDTPGVSARRKPFSSPLLCPLCHSDDPQLSCQDIHAENRDRSFSRELVHFLHPQRASPLRVSPVSRLRFRHRSKHLDSLSKDRARPPLGGRERHDASTRTAVDGWSRRLHNSRSCATARLRGRNAAMLIGHRAELGSSQPPEPRCLRANPSRKLGSRLLRFSARAAPLPGRSGAASASKRKINQLVGI